MSALIAPLYVDIWQTMVHTVGLGVPVLFTYLIVTAFLIVSVWLGDVSLSWVMVPAIAIFVLFFFVSSCTHSFRRSVPLKVISATGLKICIHLHIFTVHNQKMVWVKCCVWGTLWKAVWRWMTTTSYSGGALQTLGSVSTVQPAPASADRVLEAPGWPV